MYIELDHIEDDELQTKMQSEMEIWICKRSITTRGGLNEVFHFYYSPFLIISLYSNCVESLCTVENIHSVGNLTLESIYE